MIIAAIDTGCRQGELRRLRWSDVDFQANTLRVTSYKGKTVNRRLVPITDRLRAALLDLRAKPSVAAFRKLRTGETADNTLVLGVVDNVKKSFNAARQEAGLSHIRFHDLRHTAGTFLAGYYLNFGSKENNEKFKNLVLSAYNQFAPDGKRYGYNITLNNCGDAFKRAINKMGLAGLPTEKAIKPSSHQQYIENVLVPRGNVVAMNRY